MEIYSSQEIGEYGPIAARELGKNDGDFRGLLDGVIISPEETIMSCRIGDGYQIDDIKLVASQSFTFKHQPN
jgi:hypothetical protein